MKAKLYEVDIVGDRAKRLRKQMHKAVESAYDSLGADLGGFVVIAWDMRGDAHTCVNHADGPVGRGLLPIYVQDLISRHVTVVLTEERQSGTIE